MASFRATAESSRLVKKTQLNGFIAVTFNGANLQYMAGAYL
jgi:hypothetical protein